MMVAVESREGGSELYLLSAVTVDDVVPRLLGVVGDVTFSLSRHSFCATFSFGKGFEVMEDIDSMVTFVDRMIGNLCILFISRFYVR